LAEHVIETFFFTNMGTKWCSWIWKKT